MPDKEKNSDLIEKAIVRAIVFFDLLDYPLTLEEIWKNLLNLADEKMDASLNDVLDILSSEPLKQTFEQKNGFYFLAGRSALAAGRMRSQVLAMVKYKSALRTASLLKYVPGVKLIAVCNSLAMGNVKETSDIDFFIVTAKSRIWLTRLLVTAVTQIAGSRRHKDKIVDRACLSFYVSEDKLDLQPITLPTDPYFYYWLSSLDPILDKGGFAALMQKNDWLEKYLPNYFSKRPHSSHLVTSSTVSNLFNRFNDVWFYSFIGDWLEKGARAIQLKKMSNNRNSLAAENDSRVVISDTMLKFHETDRRQDFSEKLTAGLSKIIL